MITMVIFYIVFYLCIRKYACTQHIGLADNMIEQSEEDLYALELFKTCLLSPTVELTAVRVYVCCPYVWF